MGECRPEGEMKPENLLRGSFRLRCDGGSVNAIFTLAPTMPPKVQHLDFAVTPNLSPQTRKSVDELAAAIARNDTRTAHVPLGQLYAFHLEFGNCRYGDTLAWNGTSHASVRLDCDRGPLLAQVNFDAAGKPEAVELQKPGEQGCAPQ
jgi:hypothetical protein